MCRRCNRQSGDFYKIESEYSKEKVFNIFDSMRKYIGQRDKLELTIDELKRKLTDGSAGREIIGSILSLESQLDDFVPTDQSQIDKIFDEDKVKEVVALIEKANELVEKYKDIYFHHKSKDLCLENLKLKELATRYTRIIIPIKNI